MNSIFREATEKDYPDIISFHKTENWGLDTMSAVKHFQQNGSLIIVCEKDGKIIGKMDVMQKTRAGKEFLYIERVFIHPEWRRKGFGKQFIAFAEQECKKRGLKYIDLSVREENIAALNLYSNNGFQELGKKIYMRKEIK